MERIKCNIASAGLFAGSLYILSSTGEKSISDEVPGDSDHELQAFHKAVSQVKSELNPSALGEAGFEIMRALSMILDDQSYIGGISKKILNENVSALKAVQEQTDILLSELDSSGSDYLRERKADIRDIAKRLMDYLSGDFIADQYTGTEPVAVAAEEISPVLLASSDVSHIGALVSDKGSPNSHAAIIAGNLGIPYLYGAGDVLHRLRTGQQVIVDGNTGDLILDPSEEEYGRALSETQKVREEQGKTADRTLELSCRTRIFANISGPEDIPKLLETSADGIGLFRTELLFLNRTEEPAEEEQYRVYSEVLDAMGDKKVIIRTMDIGSDKCAGWLKIPQEINPALGLRGLRVSLERRELFDCQLRALLRAAVRGNLKVMVPMVASEWEVDAFIAAVHDADAALTKEGIEHAIPELGIMIETPAAVILADLLAKKVSFFSIGTNDLTQYTLALDREADGLDRYFNSRHEAVLRMIEMVAEKAHENGIPVGICGQLASDPKVTERLIRCGIDELSVPVSKVDATRKIVSETEDRLTQAKADNRKTDDGLTIAAFADGELVPMAEIPDAVFASGTLGPCIGILPANGNVYAPCDGTISTIAKTNHAITIRTDNGTEYLVHIGIDTVRMGGRGFHVLVKTGQRVQKDDPIAVADLKAIRDADCSPVIVAVKLSQ